MLNYKYYRSAFHQFANGIAVPLQFATGRRAGSNLRVLSCEVAKPLLFLHYLFETFSRKFLVNRKVKNSFDEFSSNSSVAQRNKLTSIPHRVVVGAPDLSVFVSLVLVGY